MALRASFRAQWGGGGRGTGGLILLFGDGGVGPGVLFGGGCFGAGWGQGVLLTSSRIFFLWVISCQFLLVVPGLVICLLGVLCGLLLIGLALSRLYMLVLRYSLTIV